MKEKLTIAQKIDRIEASDDYDSLHLDWMPTVSTADYYFVSYSHKDYKKVFKDIFLLQNNEVQPINIWYDRELRVGKDWEIEARKHIYDYNCKGVIFYISENSVISDAIHKEIEYVKKSGKSFLSVNLPIENISEHSGEYFSAAKLLDLIKPDLSGDSNVRKTLDEFFNDKVIFLKYNDTIDKKVFAIINDLVRPPLFQISYYQDKAIIDGINDLNIIKISRHDFVNWNSETNKMIPIASIFDCAFANCKWLETVELPQSIKIIGDYTFYNCSSLSAIDLSDVESIGEYAFFNCSSLNKVILPEELYFINNGTFMECADLEEIRLPQTIGIIGESAFYGCIKLKAVVLPAKLEIINSETFGWCKSLKEIEIPENVIEIGFAAFSYCEKIKNITLPDNVTSVGAKAFCHCVGLESIDMGKSVEILDKCVFEGCKNLKCIKIPNSVKTISCEALKDCVALEKIIFDGTKAEWKSIKKELNWKKNVHRFDVYCNDGTITVK